MILYILKTSLLLTFLAPLTDSLNLSPLSLNQRLSERQKWVLSEADLRADHLKVEIYTGELLGQPRTAVFLGESHVKSKLDSDLGKQVIEEFNAYGLEGADSTALWGGRFLDYGLQYLHFSRKFLAPKMAAHGSTIDDAHERAVLRDAERKKDPSLPAITLFALEVGHQPSQKENIESLILSILTLGQPCWAADQVGRICFALASGHPDEAMEPLQMIGAFLTANYLAQWAIDHAPLPQKIVSDIGLVKYRDKTMTQNIIKAYEENSNLDLLLIITGSAHMEGMGKILNQEFGFKKL